LTQPELTKAEILFWVRTHFSNVSYGSIYQFDDDNATPALSEIDVGLLSGLSSDQISIDNTLYVLATTQNSQRHILAIDENDAITVFKSFDNLESVYLIKHEGSLHHSVRQHIGNSLYEYNVYNLEK